LLGGTLRSIRPPALRTGDLLGLCAPSGAVDPEALARGVAALESLGFRVRVPDGLLERRFHSAGTVERRAEELQGLFLDDGVAGIVCARGGAGAIRLLPLLDAEAVLAHPKPFVGYSDVTALHLLLGAAGLVTFHGPMVAREFADGRADLASFRRALLGEERQVVFESGLRPLREGRAEGVLRGGCLSLLAAAAGTPWALDSSREATILLVEDVDEPPYRLERMLAQLDLAGCLKGVRGIVFGEMTGCRADPDAGYSLEDVVLDVLEPLAIPVAIGLNTGHTTGLCATVPLGVRARLDCQQGASLALLEEAVS
jgi:muramoyltetrapeptide carboxypeptidase